VEDSGDVVGVADDGEDAHPPAALAADGHVDGEHSSKQVGPAETARARGGRGGVAVVRRAGAGAVEGSCCPGAGTRDGGRMRARRWWRFANTPKYLVV
jgi:hypothetical protein